MVGAWYILVNLAKQVLFRHTHYSSTSFLHSHTAIPLTFKVSITGLVEVLLLCGFPFCLLVLVWGSEEKRSGEASRDSMGCVESSKDSLREGLHVMDSRGINSAPIILSTSMSTATVSTGCRQCVSVYVCERRGEGGSGSMYPEYYMEQPKLPPCRLTQLFRSHLKCQLRVW